MQRSRLPAAAIIAMLLPAGTTSPPAAASDTDVAQKLAQTGKISCRPALRHFCRNIHISCSGRSDIETAPFVVTLSGEAAVLDFPDGRAPDVPSGGPFRTGADFALVRLRPDADYIRVEADGRYSFRLYRRGVAYMSYGRCR